MRKQLSGVVGLDDPAGTDGEPKGAMVLPVLPFRTYSRRKSTEKNSRQMRYQREPVLRKEPNSTRSPFRSPRRGVMFSRRKRQGYPCPAYGQRLIRGSMHSRITNRPDAAHTVPLTATLILSNTYPHEKLPYRKIHEPETGFRKADSS